MKAKIGNIEFEGTPEEMRELIKDIEVETIRQVNSQQGALMEKALKPKEYAIADTRKGKKEK